MRHYTLPKANIWDFAKITQKMAVTPKIKTKTPLTSPLMVSQVFAITFAFVSMAFSMPRLVFNL